MKLRGDRKSKVNNVENKEEVKRIIEEAGMLLNNDELETVSGGINNGSGFYMTVGYCNGAYLALRPQPVWDQYNELYELWPGYEVFTYGALTNGTGLNGKKCTYMYVNYNGIWGWANASYLRDS